jgi:hypothetical protein
LPPPSSPAASRSPSPTPSSGQGTVSSGDTARPLLHHPQQPVAASSPLDLSSDADDGSPSSLDKKVAVTTTPVAFAESHGRFTHHSASSSASFGSWSKTLTLQWPAAKSSARWAIGETLHTPLASVQFFVRFKVCPLYCF